ncbi:MAG: spermidine synthase [Pyrinomonadaceae bacterium]
MKPIRTRALTPLFAATLFVSAALLFWVEPMVAKMLLPLLGGTPAVWNTCLLFFQLMLLAGYAYALGAAKWLTPRQQIVAQLALLIVAFVSLPIALAPATINSVPSEGNPAFWLIGRLLLTVGLPFFILAANSPLLQQWFAATTHTRARDPYFLYAASNTGSLLALVAYPALLEPHLNLRQQSKLWVYSYALLVALVALCALTLRRTHTPDEHSNEQPAVNDEQATINEDQIAINQSQRTTDDGQRTTDNEQLSRPRRLRWLALAFVPSSLMLGVTTFISTDIASLPLLWVVPLALYLLTLILAFAHRQLLRPRLLARILPGVTLVLVLVYLSGAAQPAALIIFVHLLYFFVAALTCHTLLAADRPAPAHLAEFYLWLATGGALGGLFNALVAPAVFNSVPEYPLAIVLACLLLWRPAQHTTTKRARQLDLVVPVCLALLTLLLTLVADRYDLEYVQALAVAVGVPLIIAYQFRRRPLRFALALGAVLLGSQLFAQLNSRTLNAERNFFGVLRVTRDERDTLHWLYNGSTIHGRQYTDFTRQCEPLSYYHREGPLGQVFSAFQARTPAPDVAIVGLGTGATAAYARANERWTFYEINPAVVGVARAPEYFTYLINCAHAPVSVVLGDARLQLQRAPGAAYGLIVLDAFSSDAIPVHLMTQQALDLYLSKLAPAGLIVFHISNRSLDLHPVVADLARSRNLACLVRDDVQPNQTEGKESSQWVVMVRKPEDMGTLLNDQRWHTLDGDANRRVWTDDFSNILSIFKWR